MAPFARALLHGFVLTSKQLSVQSTKINRFPFQNAITTSSSKAMSSSIDRSELDAWVGEMYSTFTSCTNAHSAKDVEAYWDKYFIDRDGLFVRPSGNPMSLKDYIDMATSKDITEHTGELLKVVHVKEFASGKCAVVYFEGSQVFKYKDSPNDDNAMYSVTVEKQEDGTLKAIFFQRYPGKSNLS